MRNRLVLSILLAVAILLILALILVVGCNQAPITIPIVSGDYYARADQCRQAIINLRNYASDKPWVDIWAVFYYLAFDSDAAAQDNVDGRYELVADNGNLTPAQHLANAF